LASGEKITGQGDCYVYTQPQNEEPAWNQKKSLNSSRSLWERRKKERTKATKGGRSKKVIIKKDRIHINRTLWKKGMTDYSTNRHQLFRIESRKKN